MIWLMLLVWATTAVLVALMWGKLVQWGEVGDCERVRKSPRKDLTRGSNWGPHRSAKRRYSEGRDERAFLCGIRRRHCSHLERRQSIRSSSVRRQREVEKAVLRQTGLKETTRCIPLISRRRFQRGWRNTEFTRLRPSLRWPSLS